MECAAFLVRNYRASGQGSGQNEACGARLHAEAVENLPPGHPGLWS